jgi:hypothetical protein
VRDRRNDRSRTFSEASGAVYQNVPTMPLLSPAGSGEPTFCNGVYDESGDCTRSLGAPVFAVAIVGAVAQFEDELDKLVARSVPVGAPPIIMASVMPPTRGRGPLTKRSCCCAWEGNRGERRAAAGDIAEEAAGHLGGLVLELGLAATVVGALPEGLRSTAAFLPPTKMGAATETRFTVRGVMRGEVFDGATVCDWARVVRVVARLIVHACTD